MAFPITLPMGWTESPPYFCSATETIADLANMYAGSNWDPRPHPLESMAATYVPDANPQGITIAAPRQHVARQDTSTTTRLPQQPRRVQHRLTPLAYADVFVDDEVLLAQGTPARINRFRRQVLHLNDAVFRPNDPSDPASRKEPISTKKLLKGDACWATRKQVLGWTIDTIAGTIELPPHRQERLHTILQEARNRNRLSIKAAHRLLGELRSMVLGIPGGQGLFSQLQLALTRSDKHRVRLHQGAKDALRDFQLLADDLAARPTRIAELFPTKPTFVGACDAALPGMGGVWLPGPQSLHPPLVWREPFPPAVQAQLVSFSNPHGTITNSDLELAGTLGHTAVLAPHFDLREQTLAICSDNTPAVAWQGKGAVTTQGPAAYLLRLAALHQRRHRYITQHSYIPGQANVLADMASRRFDLTDSALLSSLNALAPHSQPWTMLHLPPDVRSQLTSSLLRHRPDVPSLQVVPSRPTGSGPTIGFLTPNHLASRTPSSATSMTKFRYSECSPIVSETAEPVAVVTQSALNAYVTKYWPLQRRSPTWASRIPASRLMAPWTLG